MARSACRIKSAALPFIASAGKTATSHTVGATTVHNFDGKSGTSHTVGTTTIHNIGGEFGVSQKIGGITVHSGPLFDSR